MSEPLRLAVDTSGPVGSLALGLGDAVLGREVLGDHGTHAQTVLPAVRGLMSQAGRDLTDIDQIVVGSGPGSFTGVRVAAAVAKGLASALNRPLYAVSSLLAAALTETTFEGESSAGPELDGPSGTSHRLRGILFDARGGRLFAAFYRIEGGGMIEEHPPRFTDVEEVIADTSLRGAVLAGDGAVRNAARFDLAGYTVLPPPFGFPSADGLLRAMTREPAPAAVDLATWEPTYLRASSAERERR